jgi:hypothetical protein
VVLCGRSIIHPPTPHYLTVSSPMLSNYAVTSRRTIPDSRETIGHQSIRCRLLVGWEGIHESA